MKTILITIAILVAVSSGQLRGAEQGEHPPTNWIVIRSYGIVPVGKTYVVYDGKGKKVAQFRSGQKTSMTTDCAMIKCPPTVGKNVVCWKCMGLTAKPAGQSPYPADGSVKFLKDPINYVVYNANGKKIAEFRSGRKTSMPPDCVMIKCPPTVGKNVVCWQCKGLTAKSAGQSPVRATANVKVKEASKASFKPKPSGQ